MPKVLNTDQLKGISDVQYEIFGSYLMKASAPKREKFEKIIDWQ